MNIVLAAVGHCKPGPERTLFAHFQSRLHWRLTLKEVEEKRPLPVTERMAREASLLLAVVPKGAVIVALDERGKNLSSPEFAELLRGWRDNGRHDVAFLIGGADGLDPNVRHSAEMILSFGALTWPHMLVRGLLAEQLYRAHSILNNHPYHRA